MERIVDYRNNCTLVAIKEVTGANDEAVLAAVRAHGYKNNRGMYAQDYMDAARDLGIQFGEMKRCFDYLPTGGVNYMKRLTVGQMLLKLTKGTFFLRTRGHVMVVRDGKVVDTNWGRPALRREAVDYVEVLNPHHPVKKGFLKNFRRPAAGSRFDSKNALICKAAFEYLATHTDVTAEELLRECRSAGFTRAYLNWQLKRGNIVEI